MEPATNSAFQLAKDPDYPQKQDPHCRCSLTLFTPLCIRIASCCIVGEDFSSGCLQSIGSSVVIFFSGSITNSIIEGGIYRVEVKSINIGFYSNWTCWKFISDIQLQEPNSSHTQVSFPSVIFSRECWSKSCSTRIYIFQAKKHNKTKAETVLTPTHT